MSTPKDAELYSGGISFPFRQTSSGGIATNYGDNYITDQIKILASDCDSDNPFQSRLGIGIDNVFLNASDGNWKSRFTARVKLLFDRYFTPANLGRFVSVTYPNTDLSTSNGDFKAVITYISMETNTQLDVTMALSNQPSDLPFGSALGTGGI